MLAWMGLAAGVLGAGAWLGQRRPRLSRRTVTAASRPRPDESATPADRPSELTDVARVAAVNDRAAERLWRLAFASPSQGQASEVIQQRVRYNVSVMLQVDTLDPNLFPRRPALMPQLLQAVNDSGATERVSRIIAHDPVLTADVLRLANSSLYRTTSTPIESIQRAIVVCGVDALRGMLATAMLRPVFRATRRNFPRLPRMLWERTERATRAADLYALETRPHDRFEAQMAVLLGALGPLVVYSAALDVYARNPHFAPNAAVCLELIGEQAPAMSRRIADDWQTGPRLRAALERSAAEPLSMALLVGELFGTLALLESQAVLSHAQSQEYLEEAGVSPDLALRVGAVISGRR